MYTVATNIYAVETNMTIPRRFVVIFGIAAAISCWSNSVRAGDSSIGEGVIGTAGAILGHATLLPAYASTLHYALYPKKRMATPWTVANVTTSIMAGSLGGVMTTFALLSVNSTDSVVRNDAKSSILPAGLSLLAGTTLVTIATIVQSRRPMTNEAKRIPFMILPRVAGSTTNDTTWEFVAVGQF